MPKIDVHQKNNKQNKTRVPCHDNNDVFPNHVTEVEIYDCSHASDDSSPKGCSLVNYVCMCNFLQVHLNSPTI